MSNLKFTNMLCHIGKVKPRMERHGEDEVLAFTLPIRLMMGDVGDEWDGVIRSLLRVEPDFDIDPWMNTTGVVANSISFAASYQACECSIAQLQADLGGNDTLDFQADAFGFKLTFDDLGIVFQLKGPASSLLIGRLLEFWKHKAMVDISYLGLSDE